MTSQTSRTTNNLLGLTKVNDTNILGAISQSYNYVLSMGALPESIRLFTQIYNGLFYCICIGTDGNKTIQTDSSTEV